MTLPCERTYAVCRARQFLCRLLCVTFLMAVLAGGVAFFLLGVAR